MSNRNRCALQHSQLVSQTPIADIITLPADKMSKPTHSAAGEPSRFATLAVPFIRHRSIRMHPSRGRPASGIFLALLTLACGAAHAADPEMAERAAQLDRTIQALKDEVIEYNRDAQRLEDENLIPDHLRLSVYLRMEIGGILLTQSAVTIDDGAPAIYRYDERSARALLDDEVSQRLLTVPVSPGAHHIKISVTGSFADADPEDPPLTLSYEAIFDKGLDPSELEFRLGRVTRFGRDLKLTMTEWRPQQ